jgi:hypothetical protein
MHRLILLIITSKDNSIRNLAFLINSISNLQKYLSNYQHYTDLLTSMFQRLKDPVTGFVLEKEIGIIDNIAQELIHNKRYFQYMDFSNKLSQLWKLMDELYVTQPDKVVECVTHIADKRIPRNVIGRERDEFMKKIVFKFIGKTKKVNSITDYIFFDVKKDFDNDQLDALSICGTLLSFVLNSESHLYYVMENLKKANKLLKTSYDIEEIFSLESKVTQDSEIVADIIAIRNAVSHAAFSIVFDSNKKEYVVDFQSILGGYSFSRSYTGSRLIELYSMYDKLRDLEELLIRMIFLKSLLKLFFLTKFS